MKIISTILFCILVQFANAQKLSLSKDDKILENGAVIGMFEKTSDNYIVLTNIDEDEYLNIETVSDDELQINYYIISFADDNQSQAFLPVKKGIENIIEEVLRARVIKDANLSPEQIKLFCEKNTLDAVLKKPLAKQKKEIIKEEKTIAKQELVEEKEELAEEKAQVKLEKKELKKDELLEKKEARQDKLEEKKDAHQDKVVKEDSDDKNIDIPKNENADKAAEVILIANGKILSGNKIVGTYSALEGMIKGKKGKTITVVNTLGKRIAICKYQYNTNIAYVENVATRVISEINFYSETQENIYMEIIDSVVKMDILH